MKRMIYITDSMSSAELDSDGSLFLEFAKDGKPIGLTWRVARVAQGSGTTVREVEEVLCQYRMMANMAKQAGGKNGWLQTMQKVQNSTGGRGRGAGGMPTPAQIQAMQVRALVKDTIPLLRKIPTPRFFFQNSLPPGMLQQMQRQMRGGGGIQEMMKTLMQSQGGDQADLEEMQRMMSQVGGLGGLGGLGGGMPNMSDMFKLMGKGRGGPR
jgi:signal recognition particle subunit SRP54